VNKVQTYDPYIDRDTGGNLWLPGMRKDDKGQWVSKRAYDALLAEYNEALRFQVIS